MITQETRERIRNTQISTALYNYKTSDLYAAYDKVGVELTTGTTYTGYGTFSEVDGYYYIIQKRGHKDEDVYRVHKINADNVVVEWDGEVRPNAIPGEQDNTVL